jgi:transcription-repair coupling factor (superfamily II helicase)
VYTKVDKDKTVSQIISRLKTAPASSLSEDKSGGAVKVEGTWGSFARLLAVYISKEIGRPILYVSPHIDDADNTADDLQTFGAEGVETFPAWEGQEDLADATDEIRAERLRIVLKLLSGNSNFIISTSVQAICQPIPKPDAISAGYLQLDVGGKLSPDDVAKWLVDNGFENVDGIDLPGQFARRGGIVDVYAPLTAAKIFSQEEQKDNSQRQAEAIRIEFFGDVIESIRQIDLDTQRSGQQIKSVSLVSATAGKAQQDRELFLNILPAGTIIIFEEIGNIEEVAEVFLERVEDSGRLYNWREIYNSAAKFVQLHISRFGTSADNFLKVDVKSVQQFQHKATAIWASGKEALEELVQQAKAGKTVYLYCEADAEIKRVTEIIIQSGGTVPENFKLLRGFIHQGFMLEALKTIVISHHELFGQQMLRRRQRPIRPTLPIDTLADLQKGDYVVHLSYGIGKYLGVGTIAEKGSQTEYLTIEYAGGVKAHVSVTNIALVQKYIGTSPKRPKLNKIGSKKWQKQKEKVAKSVEDLAGDLLEMQAKRRAIGGFAFGADSAWQMEFEQSFPYQETADQTTVMEHIKADMQEPAAMDRLLCGDVGYGKTEIAMRAAFKAVENGKQVAVLVPTTVLCVQHGRTFTERFADFPVCIEVLNRFKTPAQANDIIERTKQGKVDILIGTHRLLSGDVGFKDLGLLVIDEEQRFGVEHKEKLKRLRVNIDVLTMTATPIPRTLNMAMLGLRDISSLSTPPLDRRSIVTTVTSFNQELTRKAIIQELNRQGQVFFVHNRIKTIEKRAWEIQKLISGIGARISIAHGRMAKSELEKAMIDFVLGRTDVLVCTTIIESGLDIPNANTIFIDDADRFGLAEMHQLRGRVGRYKHRAYAYMLLPKSRPITPIAARRLKAIEEYSHLGAGFRIALRDLEIRGAGNILGAEQSGHIQAVGYQMYCEMLADAVKRLKNEPVEPIPAANIDLGFVAYIPKNYIPSDRQRMEVYRKTAVARNEDDVRQIEDEMGDVYGLIPQEVKMVLDLAELRIKAGRLDIKSITVSKQDLVFSFAEKRSAQKLERLFAKTAGKVIILDPNTVHLRLGKNYFEPQTLVKFLRKILGSEGR